MTKQVYCSICEEIILYPRLALKISKLERIHKRCDLIARGIIQEANDERDELVKRVMSVD